ncbi:hypothetical protein DL98DRAFT_615474 [Cadophora sp. DSE1049]|nr:hypothetical protein DL98DRAFT_615474 [Cadophora sp. DSE1049]
MKDSAISDINISKPRATLMRTSVLSGIHRYTTTVHGLCCRDRLGVKDWWTYNLINVLVFLVHLLHQAELTRRLSTTPFHYQPSPFSRPPEPHPFDHRRPSEHSQYDHQDPRRPNSGPSHGYHNGPPQAPPPPPAPPGQKPQTPPYAGQRDPMVKRDPSDEPQQYRPPSTGVDHHVNPSPHHEGPGRPYHPSYDPARNQQYPPPQPPNSYPPVQSPLSATEPYGNNPYGPAGLPPPRDYQTVTYPSARGPDIRKKAQRAAQACDSCRTLKAKCDEGRPACSTCKEKSTECRYRDPPPKQQDKASADIMDSLARLESFMSGFNNKIEHVNKRIEHLTGEMRDMKHAQNGTVVKSAPYDVVKFKDEHADAFSDGRGGYPSPFISSESQPLLSNELPYGFTPSEQRAPDGFTPQGSEISEEESGNPGPSKGFIMGHSLAEEISSLDHKLPPAKWQPIVKAAEAIGSELKTTIAELDVPHNGSEPLPFLPLLDGVRCLECHYLRGTRNKDGVLKGHIEKNHKIGAGRNWQDYAEEVKVQRWVAHPRGTYWVVDGLSLPTSMPSKTSYELAIKAIEAEEDMELEEDAKRN